MKTLKDYISEKLIFEDSSISATDMEVMICYAHNAQRGFFNTNIANLKYCTNGSPTKEERKIPNKYKNNQEIYDSIVKDLYNLGKLRKLDTKEVSMTSVWKKLGRIDTGEVPIDNTPKTDIICDDEKIKISVKKGNGNPAQLCSAKLPEAKATLMYAKDKLKEDDEIELLNTILSAENWKSFTKLSKSITDIINDPDFEDIALKREIEDAKTNNKKVQEILQKLMSNTGYAEAVVYEAATGTIKFGKNNEACANAFFEWDTKGFGKYWPDVDAYLSSHGARITIETADDIADAKTNKGITLQTNFKTNGKEYKNAYTCMRIQIK